MSALRKQKKVIELQTTYSSQHEKNQQVLTNKRRGLMRRLAALACLAVVTALFISSTLISQSKIIAEKEVEKQKLEYELADLKKEQLYLEGEIVKLNDDEYIGKIARRDFFLSQEGEVLFNTSE
ncbi:FtsB family cell division protein [Cytobacillus sp. IB215665]|uniref:FtsB family cell division protein n=1 Tax=Cytobacillus sp. IB215665 TaxID=3097357 RepID=UPI002A0C8337|nr:septum formation initiator family protein [Cytobacillus sp. IB215665]MDX8367638.1 septum formation initiator family protein [Cytobacillus sp. IB215665]